MSSTRINMEISSVRLHWHSSEAFRLTFASAEPDLSNPTRPRFERPLDTIRSFEAAIYGSYSNNRGSYARTGIPPIQFSKLGGLS
jgi:hypothetical protein